MSPRGTCAVDLTFPSNALTYKNKALHCVYFTKNPQRATLNQQARVPYVHRMNNLDKSDENEAVRTVSFRLWRSWVSGWVWSLRLVLRSVKCGGEWGRTGKGVLGPHIQMKTCPERAEKSERLPLWIIL